MQTSNKTIMVVLGVGAVLGLAGQALAQGGSYRGRDGFRGGSDSRSSYVNRGYTGGYTRSNSHFVPPRIVDSPRSFHGSLSGGASYGHSGFSGGFSVGYVESPRYYAAPRVITPGWTSYGYPVYAAPTCGVSRPVFVAPTCGVRPPVFVVPSYRHHQYVRPTWQHYRR